MSSIKGSSHEITKGLKIALVILTCLIISLIVLVISLFFILFFLKNSDNSKNESFVREKRYKYYRIDPTSNETTVGFTTLLDSSRIEEEGYMTYKDDIGSTILVTEFGSTAYECTGTCICEKPNSDDGSSRRLKPMAVKIIKTYIATGILIVVGKFVYELMNMGCKEEMKDDCDPENVRSENEECVRLDAQDGTTGTPPNVEYTDKKIQEMYISEISEQQQQDEEYYLCTGRCGPRMNFEMEASIGRERIAISGCEDNSLDLNIEYVWEERFVDQNKMKEEHMKLVFVRDHLSPFCIGRSEEVGLDCDAGLQDSLECVRIFSKVK